MYKLATGERKEEEEEEKRSMDGKGMGAKEPSFRVRSLIIRLLPLPLLSGIPRLGISNARYGSSRSV